MGVSVGVSVGVGVAHAPVMQLSPAAHGEKQLPQLLGSLLVSVQEPKQQSWPLQEVPQLPQLKESVLVSVQKPPQQS